MKLAVAATLLIELPAPFLLLAPFRAARLAGAALQAALQALIVFSGNYNFFNLLTGCLALTLLDDDVAWVSGRRAPRRSAGPAWTWAAFTALGPLGFVHAAVEGSRALGLAVVLGVLGAGAGAMFAFEAPAGPDGRGFDVALTLTPDALTGFVGRALLPVLYAWGVVLVLGTGADVLSALGSPGNRPADARSTGPGGAARRLRRAAGAAGSAGWRLAVGGACLGAFAAGAVPFASLHPPTQAHLWEQWPPVKAVYLAASKWHVTAGYGLFRRMTGVGDRGEGLKTARPEIEVLGSADGTVWEPFVFRYKPGPLHRSPPWVAPHQPRLDWQMWFAALSTYQSNPWFVHLMWRLLQGSPAVRGLLDEASPFRDAAPKFVKADLYHCESMQPPRREGRGTDLLPKDDFTRPGGEGDAWWARERVGEYFPAVDLGNASLRKFAEDFTKGTEQARQSARGAHGSLDMSAAAPAGPTDFVRAVQRLNRLANDHAGALGLGLAGAVVGGEVAKGLRRRRRAAGRPPKQKTQ